MNRLQLIELEDQPWVPRTLRNGATDVLDVLTARAGIYRPLAPTIAAFMTAAGQRRWFDLCSGGGGGALTMRAELLVLGHGPEQITLSDRYPNEAAQQRVAASADTAVRYLPEPVDALDVPPHAPAVRTMFSALHHFPPETIRRILHAAVAARAPLAFVDVAASPVVRRLPVWLVPVAAVPNLLFLFVLALLLVPLARPFRWSRLLWTYLLPAIPALFAWDGTVSALRAYTPDELLALAASVPDSAGYHWEAGRAGPSLFLTGYERCQANHPGSHARDSV
jgi:hypothetical protein